MAYTITHFKKWSTDFADWTALKAWLTSAEGGNLRVVEPRESAYAVVRYAKDKSDFNLPHVQWCRSVIVHKDTRLPVSVAPPKAAVLGDEVPATVTTAEEFVDGTMVNVFKRGDEAPTMSTRSRLGGKTRFYTNGKTFEEMLDEALAATKVASLGDVLPSAPEGRVPTSAFTSLVLQHPSNRIVTAVDAPTFLVVHQGWVFEDGSVEITEDAGDFRCETALEGDAAGFFEINGYNLDAVRGAKTVKDWVSKQSQQRGVGWQGLVLKDGQGTRWRVRSDMYETVRRIRGNESTPEERFARLRKSRTTEQYLAFYPEDKDALYALEGRLRKNTRQLSHFYNDVFRSRTSPYHELPWPYKHHVSVLHNLFKDTLRAEGKKVDLEQVIRYVNGLDLEDTANMLKEHNLTPVKREPREVKVVKRADAEAPAEAAAAE